MNLEELKKELEKLDKKMDDLEIVLDKWKDHDEDIRIAAAIYIAKKTDLYNKYFDVYSGKEE